MTTIACRDRILASDSACIEGDTIAHEMKKLFRVRGMLVGCCGLATDISNFVHWLRKGADVDDYPKMRQFSALIVAHDGTVTGFEEMSPHGLVITAPYCAIGTGMDVALGAMYAGASAVEAVKAARAHNTATVGRVVSISLRRKKREEDPRDDGGAVRPDGKPG